MYSKCFVGVEMAARGMLAGGSCVRPQWRQTCECRLEDLDQVLVSLLPPCRCCEAFNAQGFEVVLTDGSIPGGGNCFRLIKKVLG